MTAQFEPALLAHLDMLFNLARRMTDSREEAEDLMQDTALSAWQSWQRSGPPDATGAWLATICLNRARSRYRQRASRPPERLDPDAGCDLPVGGQVDADAMAHVEAAAVRAHIARLPYHQREAICLMDLCGFSASEAARMLEVPRNTVLSRVHRGHKALAVALQSWAQAS